MTSEVILIGSDQLGSGDPKLGKILLGNFLKILCDRDSLPRFIILWNSGVKTATILSDNLDYLMRLQERGVAIISCRTCVEFFEIEGKIAVGEVVGLIRILDILSAHTVLTV